MSDPGYDFDERPTMPLGIAFEVVRDEWRYTDNDDDRLPLRIIHEFKVHEISGVPASGTVKVDHFGATLASTFPKPPTPSAPTK